MLTIDCRDVEGIMHELAVHVAEHMGAVPAIKIREFVVSPFDDDDTLDSALATDVIRKYLESIGESRNFAILADGDRVNIHSINGKTITQNTSSKLDMFSCPHCGFVTSYEVEYNAHKRIHYL